MIGRSLGPYRVLEKLGEGGMGEVYRARDTRLDRSVAIKVLPPDLAAHGDRRARFEREARAVAALNHPHICALHDIGEHAVSAEGPPLLYLVMEHLAGQTLATRLAKGPLPVAQAVEVAAQIAEALDAAHRHGIVHRDLKPANVMLTKGGAKLLDFGLARLGATHERGAVLGMSAMLTRAGGPVTQQGTIVGTLPYMAPEQLEGKPADERTDVWAFGTVLYEMLTGKPAFAGESAASLVGAILAKEPEPVAALQPLTPPALDRLVRTCLAKDPDERVQNAHDLVLHLRWAADAIAAPAVTTAPVRPWRRRLGVAAAFLVGLAVATAATLSFVRTREAAPRRVVRFSIELPAGRQVWVLALSPDGRYLAYVGVEGNRRNVFVRALDETTDRQLPETDGATTVFFSPDSRWIASFAGSKLKKVSVTGGNAVTIAELPRSSPLSVGGVWAADGSIVVGSHRSGLWRVPASGGTPVTITTPDLAHGEFGHVWPALSPDGRHVLFTAIGGSMVADGLTLLTVPLAGGPPRTLLEDATAGVALRAGVLIFGRGGALDVVGFDGSRAQVLGDTLPALDDVGSGPYRPAYDISETGDLAYVPAAPPVATSVMRVDRLGHAEVVTTVPSGLVPMLTLSADGQRLLVTREGRPWTLEVLDIRRGVLTRVASDGNPHAGVWSPDGERVLFSANPQGVKNANVFVRGSDGRGAAERLATSWQHGDPGSWSPDGRWVVYAQFNPVKGTDIWKVDMSSRQAAPFLRGAGYQRHPAISPDGRWIAYASGEPGQPSQVYVEAFPDGGQRTQVSADGGTEPLWAGDGRHLYFRSGNRLMTVPVEPGPRFSAGVPTLLFEAPFGEGAAIGPPGYAVAPDGQHFYFLRDQDRAPEPTRINIVLGWIDELEKRLGRSS